MPFSVRGARQSDAAQISICLAELGYGTSADLVAEKLGSFELGEGDQVFVVVDAGEGGEELVQGVVSVHILPLFHASGNLARITALAVRGDAQRSGVGRLLVDAAENYAWAHGCRRIEVTSGDHRPSAHSFYHALGYAADERRFLKHAPTGNLARSD